MGMMNTCLGTSFGGSFGLELDGPAFEIISGRAVGSVSGSSTIPRK